MQSNRIMNYKCMLIEYLPSIIIAYQIFHNQKQFGSNCLNPISISSSAVPLLYGLSYLKLLSYFVIFFRFVLKISLIILYFLNLQVACLLLSSFSNEWRCILFLFVINSDNKTKKLKTPEKVEQFFPCFIDFINSRAAITKTHK